MRKLLSKILYGAFVMLSTSCSEYMQFDPPADIDHGSVHAVAMTWDGGYQGFDGAKSRSGADWADGDIVYVQFFKNTARINGLAVYDSSKGIWNVEFYAELSPVDDARCEVYYFDNPEASSFNSVELSESTAIYCDKDASYSYEDNLIKLSANLKPMTGRIRMKGYSGQHFDTKSFRVYNSYSFVDNSFTATPDNKRLTGDINKDGYSDYYYGFFVDNNEKSIIFDDVENGVSYSKTLGANALAAGKSGYIDVPSMENRSGWKFLYMKDITVSNITFRMRWVVYGGDCKDNYYIGTTEVTQGLWKAVMGSANNPSIVKGDKLPVNNVSYEDCENFVKKLNMKTGGKYRLPHRYEFKWAYNGGRISKRYYYSGSSNPNEVAWYQYNSSGECHEVATLNSNELGIYDMAGNVAEYCQETGTYGYHYLCGGDYSSTSKYIYDLSSYTNNGNKPTGRTGFRLIEDI